MAESNNQCLASNELIDRGNPCRYLEGHLDAGIPHTTENGIWWSDETKDWNERNL